MYYIDSMAHRVDRSTSTRHRRARRPAPFVDDQRGAGIPDGLAVDDEGGVWVALFGGRGSVRRYRPDGELDGCSSVPVDKVTACCFGGRTGGRST